MRQNADSDNHGPKRASQLRRGAPRRAPYQKVLIVCEGEKTEPYYLNGLKAYYGLSTANVEITGDCGSDPISIVNHAKDRYRSEQAAGDPFDRVYCVFDRDSHPNYRAGLAKINGCKPKGIYYAATSVPCFEYWLLLHFKYTTRPYEPLPGNSPCDQVISELKDYLPGYRKAQPGIFESLVAHLEKAKNHAIKVCQAAKKIDTDNPSTRVHDMIEYLQNIKTSRTS